MSRRIGIFLAYAPEQSLADHGLGRLLAMLVRGMTDTGTRVVLGMPSWLAPEVRKVLRDFHVDESNVEWLLTPAEPVLLRLRRLAKRRRAARPLVGRLAVRIARAFAAIGSWVLDEVVAGLASTSLLRFMATLLIAIGGPLALLALAAWHFPLTTLVVLVTTVVLAAVAAVAMPRTRAGARWLKDRARKAFGPLRDFKNVSMARMLYTRMRQQELRRLIGLVNRRGDITGWLVPTLFWPEAAGIRAPKTVVVPDLVMLDAPVHFAAHVSIETFDQLRETIACADRLICYSEHVKDVHLVRRFGIPPAQVSVVEHAPVDMMETFRKPIYAERPVVQAARMILRRHLAAETISNHQIRNVDLASVGFIFYASQIRPHKNILALVRAYEKLLRHHLVNVKLVLTGDLLAPEAARVATYVWEKRLQFDVISLPRVPADVLAALFALTRLAVCPTLFEGGLPFTFSEALSVGTPVVMSRIPAVTEKIRDPELARLMLFDPFDADNMCERIRWGLENRDVLLARQQAVYRQLATRTWSDVASDYCDAMAFAPVAEAP